MFHTTMSGFDFSNPADFFLISIWYEGWVNMTPEQRRALIDHELCHCIVEEDEETGNTKLGMRGHDIEEFNEIVSRHGFWRPEVQTFVEEAQAGQNSLFDTDNSTMSRMAAVSREI